MAGEHKGWCDCSECGAASPVRLNKNNKIFYVCPECGLIYPNTKEGQARLQKRMRATEAKVEKQDATPAPGEGDPLPAAGAVSPKPSPAADPVTEEKVTLAPAQHRGRFGGW